MAQPTPAATSLGSVLDTGEYWFWYTSAGTKSLAGGIHGKMDNSNGKLSSLNGKDFSGETQTVERLAIQGQYKNKEEIQGRLFYANANGAGISFEATYDATYEMAPNLNKIAGKYSAKSVIRADTTFTIDATGKLNGSDSNGCKFNGTLAPRSKGNVYNLSIDFDPKLCPEVQTHTTTKGVAFLDAVSHELYGMSITDADGYMMFIATKNK